MMKVDFFNVLEGRKIFVKHTILGNLLLSQQYSEWKRKTNLLTLSKNSYAKERHAPSSLRSE